MPLARCRRAVSGSLAVGTSRSLNIPPIRARFVVPDARPRELNGVLKIPRVELNLRPIFISTITAFSIIVVSMRGLFRRMHVDDTYATTYGTLSCVIGFSSYRRKRNPRASCTFSRYPTVPACSTTATPVARRFDVVRGRNFLNNRPIRARFDAQGAHRRDENEDVRHHRVRSCTRKLRRCGRNTGENR